MDYSLWIAEKLYAHLTVGVYIASAVIYCVIITGLLFLHVQLQKTRVMQYLDEYLHLFTADQVIRINYLSSKQKGSPRFIPELRNLVWLYLPALLPYSGLLLLGYLLLAQFYALAVTIKLICRYYWMRLFEYDSQEHDIPNYLKRELEKRQRIVEILEGEVVIK